MWIFGTTSVVTPLYYVFEPLWYYRRYKRHKYKKIAEEDSDGRHLN